MFYKINNSFSLVNEILNACYQLQLQSILIEGGTKLLQSFIEESAWDETWVIENNQLIINDGLHAPSLSHHHLLTTEMIGNDVISYYKNDSAYSV